MTWTSKTRSVTPGSWGRMSCADTTAGAGVGTACAVSTPEGTASAASVATTARRRLRRVAACGGGTGFEGCSISLPLHRGPCVSGTVHRARIGALCRHYPGALAVRATSCHLLHLSCRCAPRTRARSGGAAGRAALDELGREQRGPGGRRGGRAQLREEALDGERPEVPQRRGDGRERRGAEVGAEDVVEPDDAHVAGDLDAEPPHAAHRADRDEVVVRDGRRGGVP